MPVFRSIKIGGLGKVVTGKTPPSIRPELFGAMYPFLTPTDIDGHARFVQPSRFLSEQGRASQSRLLLPRNAVCVVCIGATIGKTCMTRVPSFTNQQINAVVVNEAEHDPFFIYHVFTTLRDDLRLMAGGAATPIINKTTFSDIEINVPQLTVQRRIAGILSAYDDLIENSQRRIRILEEMARRLYREWFVHFRFPGHEGCRFVESPLGEIPEGWDILKIGEIADVFRGRSYRSVDLSDEAGLPFLNLKCLDRDGGFRRTGLKRYIGDHKESHIARKGDIIMAVTDMTQERRIVARPALVPTLGGEFGVISMDLVRIEPRLSVTKSFLYSFLRYSSFADEVKHHANGANVLHLSPERITEYQLILPVSGLASKYTNFVEPIYEEIDILENRLEKLRRTRDLLLPRLLSGQIDVEALDHA